MTSPGGETLGLTEVEINMILDLRSIVEKIYLHAGDGCSPTFLEIAEEAVKEVGRDE